MRPPFEGPIDRLVILCDNNFDKAVIQRVTIRLHRVARMQHDRLGAKFLQVNLSGLTPFGPYIHQLKQGVNWMLYKNAGFALLKTGAINPVCTAAMRLAEARKSDSSRSNGDVPSVRFDHANRILEEPARVLLSVIGVTADDGL